MYNELLETVTYPYSNTFTKQLQVTPHTEVSRFDPLYHNIQIEGITRSNWALTRPKSSIGLPSVSLITNYGSLSY